MNFLLGNVMFHQLRIESLFDSKGHIVVNPKDSNSM